MGVSLTRHEQPKAPAPADRRVESTEKEFPAETFGSPVQPREASKKRNYTYKDITGRRFHRLVAEYPTEKRDSKGFMVWHCRCDCGNEVDVSYNSLAYANMRSCGCLKKEHDRKLGGFLTHVGGTSVDMLKSKKVPKNNTTGIKGVYLIRGKYTAKIVFQRKAYYLGTYDRLEEAAEARRRAEEILCDNTVAFYEKWKAKADADPQWAEANPVSFSVTKTKEGISVDMLPHLE